MRLSSSICQLFYYISDLTEEQVEKGDIKGLVLTGLATQNTVNLVANYLEQTGDIQSSVLLLSSNEESVSRLDITHWIETFLSLFNFLVTALSWIIGSCTILEQNLI